MLYLQLLIFVGNRRCFLLVLLQSLARHAYYSEVPDYHSELQLVVASYFESKPKEHFEPPLVNFAC